MSDWSHVALWVVPPLGVVAAGFALGRRARRVSAATFAGDPAHPWRPGANRPAAGDTVAGRYRLIREIGRGGTGTVHLAEDLQEGRRVALKTVLLPANADDRADAQSRFRREAAVAQRLRHPDIVTVWNAGEAHGIAFIAMELLEGVDLSAHVGAGSLLPVDTVLRMGARIALALDHAHRQGVVHRDVKPANLLREASSGTVKVTDFGIARWAEAERTRTGVLLGTPLYASPEQIAGGHIDGRSDLYSLGVVLFQLVTGALPYRDGSTADLLRQIAADPPPSVADQLPELAATLDPLFARALQKRPGLRYGDGRDFAADLLGAADRLRSG